MAGENQGRRKEQDRIVLVDNDPIVSEAIGELLRSKGYEVSTAHDGLEGLQIIRKLAPAYVLLNIILPKIDGSRVCWLVRQDPRLRNTLIIAFSDLSPEQIRRFPELSADAYVAKGPLSIVANNILSAIAYLNEKGGGSFEGGIFGYEGFRSRQLLGEMLFARRFYETLLRTLDCGVLQLDEEGRILMANVQACKILGKRESRLIAGKLHSFIPHPHRRLVEEALEGLGEDELLETRRVAVTLSGSRFCMRLSPVMDEAQFKGILVTLDPMQPDAITPQQ